METTDVLIAGAGPAGLALAVELARRGIAFRLVDRRPAPASGSGCPTLWPRTLDILAMQGVDVDALRAAGVDLRRKVYTVLGDTAALDLTPGPGRPYGLSIGQDATERALGDRLAELGGRVERGWAVTATRPGADEVVAELSGPGGVRPVRASWFVRATGPAAAGPAELKTFPGLLWARADVVLAAGHGLDPHDEHIVRTRTGHAGLVPLPGGRHRLFVALPRSEPAVAASVIALARDVGGWIVDGLDHASLWWQRPVSRLAARHRDRRTLWIGEAAVRYPMPVTGMNGAVHDAFNLGWKLAAVVRGEAGTRLLDTYALERRTAATELLRRAERIIGFGATAAVDVLRDRLRRGVFDARDEPEIRYGDGDLTVDHLAGGPGPVAGAPVPVLGVPPAAQPGYPGWTAIGPSGDVVARLRTATAALGNVRFRQDPAGPVLLIRPDGHVGWRGPVDAVADLGGYARSIAAA